MSKTINDLIEATGKSPKTVRRLIKAGQLPGYQPAGKGGDFVIPDEAFDAWCRGEFKPQFRPPEPIRPLSTFVRKAS